MLAQCDDATRQRLAIVEERLGLLEEMLGLVQTTHFPPSMKVSTTHERLLKLLIATPRLTHDAAFTGLYAGRHAEPSSANLLQVHIARIRRILRPLKITVTTVHGVGWEIDETDRDRLRGMLK